MSTDTWINRVQGLIAKAESTEFPEEAEALMGKAQELMTRHAIDMAMLSNNTEDRGVPTTATIRVQAPYASAKESLLAGIAAANDVKCVMAGKHQVAMIGFAADIEAATTLFASMSIQAARAMAATPVPPYDTPRRFRHAFMLGYAGRIATRLKEARQSVINEAESAGESVAVVLASKSDAVAAHFKELYPRTQTRRSTSSSRGGHLAGRNAADRASLGHRGVAGGSRALTG